MTVNVGQFWHIWRKNWNDWNVGLPTNAKNKNRACDKWRCSKKNGNDKETVANSQKETAVISGAHCAM